MFLGSIRLLTKPSRCFTKSKIKNFTTTRSASSASLIESQDAELKSIFAKDLILIEDFISKEEEESLLSEIEPYMKKLRYEYDHWDDVKTQELLLVYIYKLNNFIIIFFRLFMVIVKRSD